MRHIRERIADFIAIRIVTSLCIVFLAVVITKPAGTVEQTGDKTQTEQNKNTASPLIEFGRFPPDFELPKLTFSTDADGKPVGRISEKDTIKLSSFRSKRPVCLIMSSYT